MPNDTKVLTGFETACALGQPLLVAAKFKGPESAHPRILDHLAVTQVGVSSLGAAVTAGCGAGDALRALGDELYRLASLADERS